MVKIKFFKMEEGKSEEVAKFMEDVKVVENGIIASEGMIGILYKERSEVGMSLPEMITAISGELAKSQKQFLTAEGFSRAYKALIEKFEAEKIVEEEKAKEFEDKLAINRANYENNETIKAYRGVGQEIAEVEWMYKQVTKPEKPEFLKKIKELNDKKVMLRPEWEKLTNDMENEEKALTNQMGLHKVNVANTMGKIKQTKGELEESDQKRDDAKVFIEVSQKYIKELESGEIKI